MEGLGFHFILGMGVWIGRGRGVVGGDVDNYSWL